MIYNLLENITIVYDDLCQTRFQFARNENTPNNGTHFKILQKRKFHKSYKIEVLFFCIKALFFHLTVSYWVLLYCKMTLSNYREIPFCTF